jgi:hypothetical protein
VNIFYASVTVANGSTVNCAVPPDLSIDGWFLDMIVIMLSCVLLALGALGHRLAALRSDVTLGC